MIGRGCNLSRKMSTMTNVVRVLSLALLIGCRPAPTVYRTLTDTARRTCDANQRFRVDVQGADERAAREAGEEQIRATARRTKSCGALIVNDAAGSRLDGGFNYGADYQLCRCE